MSTAKGYTTLLLKTESGVPKGSVPKLLLFMISINDICPSLTSNNHFFAGGCVLFREMKYSTNATALQIDLNTVCDWWNIYLAIAIQS